jgi:hypothetical protein
VDGNGFKANGDSLGYDVPVMKMTVEQVQQLLGQPSQKTKGKVQQ